jgi:hypothetical protein
LEEIMSRFQWVYAIGIGGLLLLLAANAGRAEGAPRIFQSSGKDLARVKEKVASGDPALTAAVKRLLVQADRALKAGPFSVVHAKPIKAPSGDIHDYISMAPYFWPDPTKPNGLPYMRRDGRVNPERNQYDRPLLGNMCQAVDTLALAYYLTGEERYAAYAARLLRTWFLDADTLMNPNLNFGQFVPGVNDGRGTGIIDTVSLLRVVDAVGLLHGARNWTAADQSGMEDWFRRYLRWLETSKHGKQEAAATNNHGTWYDAQVTTFALFVGEVAGAKRVLEASKQKRIARQIEPDGRQPRELTRTKSFGYSLVNLRGLVALATLGEQTGVDLWHYRSPDGRGIRAALDFLLPFATGAKEWKHEQLGRLSAGQMAPLLRRAADVYGDARYEQAIGRLVGARDNNDMIGILYPKKP